MATQCFGCAYCHIKPPIPWLPAFNPAFISRCLRWQLLFFLSVFCLRCRFACARFVSSAFLLTLVRAMHALSHSFFIYLYSFCLVPEPKGPRSRCCSVLQLDALYTLYFLCMLMQNYFLCPTLGNIPGCHLTLYGATHTYGKAFARGCRWLSVYVSRSAGRIFVFITHALAGCNDCFYLFSWQSRRVCFFRRLLQMLTSVTSVIFLLAFHLAEIRPCAEGYASCNCLHYQI